LPENYGYTPRNIILTIDKWVWLNANLQTAMMDKKAWLCLAKYILE